MVSYQGIHPVNLILIDILKMVCPGEVFQNRRRHMMSGQVQVILKFEKLLYISRILVNPMELYDSLHQIGGKKVFPNLA